MEGHLSDIIATGHGDRIVVVLVCSFIFPILSGPFLAFSAWQYRKNQSPIERWTMDFVCMFLLIILAFVNIIKEIVVHEFEKENLPICIEAMLPIIVGQGFIFFFITGLYRFGTFCIHKWKDKKLVRYIVCANLVAYHFCWLVVGIMLNPLWGLFDLLGICLVVGVVSYFVHQYFKLTDESSTNTNTNTNINTNNNPFISRPQSFYWSFSCVLATICFLFVVVLIGQSYNGKETADQIFKDVLGFLIPVCFAWLGWKNRRMKGITSVDRNPSNDIPLL